MIKLFVFWVLVVGFCLILGVGVTGLFGDKIYNKANDIKDIYTKEEKEKEVNEQ